ncbi:uncharacterized protein LOC105193698 [Solenopsis invicta]|uniref:uncharacterized protein LOC105193698 n=1 Tax=Solenopsis invicta TaxID=13686 RepID=UPI000595A9D7|nr:uncharacterized protein LOC105193698 [Solenopsis invicta]XP_011156544.1 uncharacterized protein LOC105193698 [Solenopsis invicta]
MFVNKKNSLPPRPQVPNHEHILEDLEKAGVDDVAFKIINDLCVKDGSMDSNSSDIYKKVKTYLNTKQQLKQLESTLKKEEQQMHTDNEEIKRLADDIRKQAEAALVTH